MNVDVDGMNVEQGCSQSDVFTHELVPRPEAFFRIATSFL